MQQEIICCEKCGRLVSRQEIDEGTALITNRGAACARCESRLHPEDRGMVVRRKTGGAEAGAEAGGEADAETGAAPDAEGAAPGGPGAGWTGLRRWARQRPALLACGAVGGSLLLIAVTSIVVSSGTGEPETGKPDAEGLGARNAPKGVETPGDRPTEQPAQNRSEALEVLKAAYARMAERELDEAVRRAGELAREGDFKRAAEALTSVREAFAASDWLDETSAARIAAELEKVRHAKDLAVSAHRRLGAKAAAPGSRPKPGALDVADKLAPLLAGFDSFMAKGDYARARKAAEAEAAKPANAPHAEALRSAARVAGVFADRPAAVRRGAESMVGKQIELTTKTGTLAGELKKVTDDGLIVATAYYIDRLKLERPVKVAWSDLASDQEREFVDKGGLEVAPGDQAILGVYWALRTKHFEIAESTLEGAAGHPLAGHLGAQVEAARTEGTYPAAMKRVRSLMRRRSWNAAVAACEVALGLRPDDPEATKLLAEAQSHIGPAPTLILDLGGGVTMEFVYVKPGRFMMGGHEPSRYWWQGVEKPIHAVAITRGFYIGKYEVTQAQYEAAVGANPSNWKGPNRPVEQVSWHEAVAFCRLAAVMTGKQVRLPTEAEWEYACRTGRTGKWCFGSDEARLSAYAWYKRNSGSQTHPVGRKRPNAWGLHDMHGNVWEWVADWYDPGYYANSPRENPTGPDAGKRRLLRGGSWFYHGSLYCRAAVRFHDVPSSRYNRRGFRVAVSASVPGSSSEPARTTTLTRGLVGHWKFDERRGDVAHDSSGKGNHGRIRGATWARGKIGGALEFDGRNDHVSTPLRINQARGSPGATYAAWVNPTSVSEGRHQLISSDDGGYDWSVLRVGGIWHVFNGAAARSARSPVDIGKWQHVAAVFDPRAGNVRFYKNGVETVLPGIGYDANDRSIAVGDNPSPRYRDYFKGTVDDVRMYNRALSAAEVKALASAGAVAAGPKMPWDARRFGGHWYKLFRERRTWREAKRHCESLGGHLVTVGSPAEQEFVAWLARTAERDVWIGLMAVGEGRKWQWVTGEEITFKAWAPGEPTTQRGEDRARMSPGHNFRWMDRAGAHELPYVCEWDKAPAGAAVGPAAGIALCLREPEEKMCGLSGSDYRDISFEPWGPPPGTSDKVVIRRAYAGIGLRF